MIDQSSWHLPDEALAAYVDERTGASDAWSVEAHVVQCPACRGRLAGLVRASPLAGLLTASQADLATALPGRAPARTATQPVHLVSRALGRWPWLVAVVVAAAAALGLGELFVRLHPVGAVVPLTWAVAPIVPLAGVALTFTRRSDPWGEVVLSTPTQGLALVLWRCVAVLVAAAPLTLAVGRTPGVDTPAGASGMSLVAMLAMSLLALTLGTYTGLETATVIVAGAWSILTVFPILVAQEAWLDALSPRGLPVWGAIVLASMAIVGVRRAAFERLPALNLPGAVVR